MAIHSNTEWLTVAHVYIAGVEEYIMLTQIS